MFVNLYSDPSEETSPKQEPMQITWRGRALGLLPKGARVLVMLIGVAAIGGATTGLLSHYHVVSNHTFTKMFGWEGQANSAALYVTLGTGATILIVLFNHKRIKQHLLNKRYLYLGSEEYTIIKKMKTDHLEYMYVEKDGNNNISEHPIKLNDNISEYPTKLNDIFIDLPMDNGYNYVETMHANVDQLVYFAATSSLRDDQYTVVPTYLNSTMLISRNKNKYYRLIINLPFEYVQTVFQEADRNISTQFLVGQIDSANIKTRQLVATLEYILNNYEFNENKINFKNIDDTGNDMFTTDELNIHNSCSHSSILMRV